MMFEQIKSEVVCSLIPDYLKTLYGINNFSTCEEPTSIFIHQLAKLLLPDKQVTIGEPQDQKGSEEKKEPLELRLRN